MPEDILLWGELDEMAAKHDNFKVWYCGVFSDPRFCKLLRQPVKITFPSCLRCALVVGTA